MSHSQKGTYTSIYLSESFTFLGQLTEKDPDLPFSI